MEKLGCQVRPLRCNRRKGPGHGAVDIQPGWIVAGLEQSDLQEIYKQDNERPSKRIT